MSKTTKKITKINEECNATSFDLRTIAVSLATELFAKTPFGLMIGPNAPQNEGKIVKDVPFYSLTSQIYAFLKTGTFEEYDNFLKNMSENPNSGTVAA